MTGPDPDLRYWPTAAAYRLPPDHAPEQLMHLDTTVDTAPPDTTTDDGDGDNERSVRLSVDFHDDGGRILDAGVALYGDRIDDPEEFATALLGAALALAALRGPDYAWAVTARFAAYDGTRR